MKARLSVRAQAELRNGRAFYRDRSAHTASRFVVAVRKKLDEIVQFPMASQDTGEPHRRRAVVSGFPYVILYEVRSEELYIASIFHTSRDPNDVPDA